MINSLFRSHCTALHSLILLLASAASFTVSTPLHAKVTNESELGFAVLEAVQVEASPEVVWEMLLAPQKWWSGKHSFSGDAENFSLDPVIGGCFCEALPNEATAKGPQTNQAEHMQVVYLEKPRVLRMTGALGPLQGEAVNGTMTIALEPRSGGTLVSMSYVVGGYSRTPLAKMAAPMDGVLGDQLLRLKQVAEGKDPDAAAEEKSIEAGDSTLKPEDVQRKPMAGKAPIASEKINDGKQQDVKEPEDKKPGSKPSLADKLSGDAAGKNDKPVPPSPEKIEDNKEQKQNDVPEIKLLPGVR